jgi:hypothetical protein
MNKSGLKICIFITIFLIWLAPVSGFSQKKSVADTTRKKIENYREQIRRLIGFLEFSLNSLGSSETTTKEKEIIINDSFLKAFLNEKVQIEDDLDENREILTYKDVQAYLKDVDFFFKQATFKIDVQDIQELTNDQGMPYFKVTANRNLQAVTVDGKMVNNNKTRYIEINLDENEQVLKIASIYTTRLNESAEMITWWNNMPLEWKFILGENYLVTADIKLSQINFLNDTTFLVSKSVPEIIQKEAFIHIDNDSLLVIVPDTILKETYDTVMAGKNNSLRMLKEISARETLEIPGNMSVTDLYPIDQLTELRTLNIANTLIRDLFPARNLTRLVALNISGTNISDLEPIRYNSKIKELYIDSTSVRSLEPIQQFKSLEVLHLSNSSVDSLFYIRGLDSLKDLRLDNTRVSDLSPLGDLVNLEILSVSGTQTDSLSSVKYLITLKRISFENTKIADLGPLSKLENLQLIDADRTLVTSLEPLDSLPALEKVYCDQTPITRSQANVFMAKHPKVLIIYESQELTSWWAGLSPDWQKIFRGYAKLDPQPTTEQLHQLTLLSQIDIEGNDIIASLEPLAKLTNLQEIKAGRTKISDITPLSELIDLKILSCTGTRVSSLLPLKALVKLENLDFSGSLIDSLAGLNNLEHLQVLQIERTGVDDLRPLIDCHDLRILYCDNTRVGKADIDKFLESNPDCLIIYQTSMLKTWWTGLTPAWKTAFKAQTQLDDPPTREQLHILAGLKSLDLSGNRSFISLQPLTTLYRLEDLNLSNGVFQDLSSLRELVRLKKLNLSGNPVSDLIPIGSLPDLVQLDISNTAITKLDALQTITSLEQLNCSGTQIKKLDPLSSLSRLKKLECYGTGVSNLKPLADLSQLKQLVCYNTKLSKKKVDAFKAEKPGLEVVFY